jgi:hypothetical protein
MTPDTASVARRLHDGWEADQPCFGPSVWCWFRGDDDPEPMTEGELAAIQQATAEEP